MSWLTSGPSGRRQLAMVWKRLSLRRALLPAPCMVSTHPAAYRRRLRRPLLRLCGTLPSREAVTAQQAARQHSPTPCRALRLPERRTTKRTGWTTGSSGTRPAPAAAGAPHAGSWTTTRPARPQPAISTGTGTVTTRPASTPTTRPRLHRASPRGAHTAPRGRTQT